MTKIHLLVIEIVLLYVLMPLLTSIADLGIYKVIPLMVIGISLAVFLITRKDFNNRYLYSVKNAPLLLMIIRFVLVAVVVFIFTWHFHPELLFKLPRQQPYRYLQVLILYAFLSVVPQEVIYRVFFFYRYKKLFSTSVQLIIVNAILFSGLHVIYHNWIAVIFAFVGGLIFADTYRKTESLLLVSVEHYFYGVMVFTVGLGSYFM